MRKPYSSLSRNLQKSKEPLQKPSIVRLFVDALALITIVCVFAVYATHFYQLSKFIDNPSRILSYDDIISPLSYFIFVAVFYSFIVFILFLYLTSVYFIAFSIALNQNIHKFYKLLANVFIPLLSSLPFQIALVVFGIDEFARYVNVFSAVLFMGSPILIFLFTYFRKKRLYKTNTYYQNILLSFSRENFIFSYIFSVLFILPFNFEKYSILSPEGTHANLSDTSSCPEAPRVVWVGARAALLRCEAKGAGGKIIIIYGPENLTTVEQPSLAPTLPAKSMAPPQKSALH